MNTAALRLLLVMTARLLTVLVLLLPAAQFATAQTIENEFLRVTFDGNAGTLRLEHDGRVFAEGTFLEPGQGTCTVEQLDESTAWGPGLVMKLARGQNRVVLRSGSPLVLIRRDPRDAPAAAGNRVTAFTASLDLGVPLSQTVGLGPAGLFQPADNPGQHVLTAIADSVTGAGVIAGLVQIDAASGVVLTEIQNDRIVMTLRNDYGSVIPPELPETGGDWWAVGCFEDARRGLERYAEELARLAGIHIKPAPVGLMTWYCEKYGGALNETAVIEAASFLAEKFKDFGYGFVQIDDLWQNGQKRNGPAKDFTRVSPSGPYPGGMQPVAQQIRALGLTPGLWLLPFAIDHQDPVLSDVASLVVRTPDGAPYETNWSGTALDLTRPEARDYVQHFIRQAVHDWGYGYLKLDGLHIGMASQQTYPRLHYVEDEFGKAVFYDKTKSNMQAGRMGLQAVREAAGPDTFILGCCTPQNERSLGMTLGLVDAMRVGPDSGVQWPGVIEGVRCSSALYFLNGRVWWNDPDAIYARNSMPLHEVQCFAGWVALTGMLNNQTDWAPDYALQRIELLRRTMPSHQLTSVRPVDLFEHDPARIWVLTYEVSGVQRVVLGLFNWTDEPMDFEVPCSRADLRRDVDYAALEFWSGELTTSFRDTLRYHLPARSGRVLAVREVADHPVLLGTSRHVTQGAVDLVEEGWNPQQQILRGTSRMVGGDPYELRILATGKSPSAPAWRVANIELSTEDGNSIATAETSQDGPLWRVRILSPKSGTVHWNIQWETVTERDKSP